MNNDILVICKNVGAGTGDLLGTGPAAPELNSGSQSLQWTPVVQHSSCITAMPYSKHACQQPAASR